MGLSPSSQRRVARALQDAETAVHKSDLEQNKRMSNNKEIANLRSALRALIEAVQTIASDSTR